MTNPFSCCRLPIECYFLGDRYQEIRVKTAATDEIGELLKRTKTIAVVGLSDSPLRPSHGVSAYMQSQGYRIIPVNPAIKGALGEKAVPSLSDVGETIDIVDVFRRSEFVPDIVDEAIRLKLPAIWLQEGVIHEEAAAKARKAGIFVVMDLCILKEHRRRFS
ncbi:MAG: CoA-binding protein [Acidobacteriia bacterium]|nr:CoA-binding protein [Terriglobia bacterium]